MKLKILIALLLISICGCEPKVLHYQNSYHGLITGKSTIKEVERKLGAPEKIVPTSNGMNYHYKEFIINFSEPTPGKINSITIHNDTEYATSDGIKIGTTAYTLHQKTGLPVSNYMTDKQNGIVYWIDMNSQVSKIVLAQALLRENRNKSE